MVAVAENEIHLWQAQLDVPAEKIAVAERVLQPDELERADRFRFSEHRIRYVAARAILRNILATHLGCGAEAIRFSYGKNGKPALATPADSGIEFNLSHSRDLAVYAVARGRAVGVDVEYIKPGESWLRIAGQHFSAAETEELRGLAPDAMQTRFFEMWSAREARVKALGEGVWYPLESGHALWPVTRLNVQKGYSAALAYAPSEITPVIIKHCHGL